MDIETRLDLITRPPIEEVITVEDMKKLLETKTKITAYDGFETSGLLHLGSGILRAIKINDLFEANVNFILLIADWYAWINNKMGGDLDLIKRTGKYFIEGWKACGIDMKKVKVMWASDLVKDSEYWKNVISISKLTTIQRAIRAGTIMGREEAEMQYVAQVLYPMMQAYDPFYLGADVMQLGMDQRKAMILTREVAPKVDGSIRVAAMHHLLIGLKNSQRMGPAEAKERISYNYSEVQINFNEVHDKLLKLIPLLDKLKSVEIFSKQIQDINDIIFRNEARKEDLNVCISRVEELKSFFEREPEVLFTYFNFKLPSILKKIKHLSDFIGNKINNNLKILSEEWREWTKNFDELQILLRQDIFTEMMQLINDSKFKPKMSKSIAESAIFIHDTKEEIENKIKGAFCQPKDVENNPILELWKYIVLRKFKSRTIERKNKSDLELQSYEELEKAYRSGDLHPADLKKETVEALDSIIKPARSYFENNEDAKELYDIVRKAQITR